jgi:glycosyltransferase involved in cell wall biosynthesis
MKRNQAWPLAANPITKQRQQEFSHFVGPCRPPSLERFADSSHSPWPRLSIIVPSFNQVAFLEQTLTSIANQRYPNLEVIVVDGGSTDGSVEVIRKYESLVTFWRSYPDDGQASAINEGFRRATGDWVAFQNSDDCYLPDAFRVAMAHGRLSDYQIVQGHFINISASNEFLSAQVVSPARLRYHIHCGIQFHNQALFFRRALLSEVGWFDESLNFCFDYEFYGRLLLRPSRCLDLPYFLGAFRHHESAKTTRIKHVGISERERLAAELSRDHKFPRSLTRATYQMEKAMFCASSGAYWRLLPSYLR